MDESLITVRYAKALFSLAGEKNLVPDLKKDMETLLQLSVESVEFVQLLENPVINATKKTEVFNTVFSGKVHPYTLDFLKIVAKNRRETYIPAICRNFIDFFKKEQGLTSVVLTTSTAINKPVREAIIALLKTEINSNIELKTIIDADIIGGLILRIDDKQLDASVTGQLHNIKNNLKQTN